MQALSLTCMYIRGARVPPDDTELLPPDLIVVNVFVNISIICPHEYALFCLHQTHPVTVTNNKVGLVALQLCVSDI